VNNDPVNWVDLWGLSASDAGSTQGANAVTITKSDGIAEIARSYIGSTSWNYEVAKSNFKTNTNKCNLFVYEVLSEANASPGLPNGNPIRKLFGYGSPPTAGQWANPDYEISGWVVLSAGEQPSPGDVAAQAINYIDATGHVAIVTGDGLTTGTSSIGVEQIKETDWGFGVEQEGKIVFRRWEGND
jgi:hypothetical protein